MTYYKYKVDISDIGVDYQDSGAWRCYGVEAFGNNLSELINSATIYETDQDGGTLDCYDMDVAESAVYQAAKTILKVKVDKDELM